MFKISLQHILYLFLFNLKVNNTCRILIGLYLNQQLNGYARKYF